MDGSRFDSLARSLAGASSRRGFVGGLLALGAGLAGVSVAGAACPPGRVSSRGRCLCKQTGRPPVGGACPCPAGLSDTGDGQGCVACHADGDCPAGDACTAFACVGGACARTVCAAVALDLIGLRFDGPLYVDDDLTVYLNGVAVFADADGTDDAHPPIALTARNGDALRVVATNSAAPHFKAHLDPFALRRVSDRAQQVLDAAGVDQANAPVGVFYDRTFTVALP